MNTKTKQKLASYGAISGAFLMSASPEAEAQVTYVDIPDISISVTSTASSSGSTSGFASKYFVLDPNDGTTNVYYEGSSEGQAQRNRINARASGNIGFLITANTKADGVIRNWRGSVSGGSGQFVEDANLIGKFDLGDLIGTVCESSNLTLASIYSYSSTGGGTFRSNGNFVDGNEDATSSVSGYLGFKFIEGGETFVGWARVTIEITTDGAGIQQEFRNASKTRMPLTTTTTLILQDYAFNQMNTNNGGTNIQAGDGAAAIPTIGQWGLIVLNLFLLIFGVIFVQEKRNKTPLNVTNRN